MHVSNRYTSRIVAPEATMVWIELEMLTSPEVSVFFCKPLKDDQPFSTTFALGHYSQLCQKICKRSFVSFPVFSSRLISFLAYLFKACKTTIA